MRVQIFQAVGTGAIADLESKLNAWLANDIDAKGWKVTNTNMVSYQEPDPYDEGKTQPGATLLVWFEEKATN
ncbi:hypothetical protein [Bradyrhizobium sp. dw_78]|uniref:hypothetical protein n=1 Tax=Bradyrhizobium sp. dw_78 TaxID=2719793 RepID=UPI001BD65D27|nr:hypothetical protein [Bradyrhizobium sp. dw_78]